ncbi:MAG: phosphate ABC transporter permease subunit PstC [Proteobacteria bacterium]|nr:phosphate ABC transporter permease subunit PstC [Pseudomonadota bacterium]MBU1612747.1 phosphate ABC transporter permease subunit PstC [Pseudomonadota bacterium]
MDEILRYVGFFLEQQYADAENVEGEDSQLKAAQLEVDRIKKTVDEQASVVRRKGQGKSLNADGLAFIRNSVEHGISGRATVAYSFAAMLLLAVAITATLKALHLQRRTRDRLIQACFFVTALTSILILLLIMIFLFKEGLPLFKDVSVSDFLLGRGWYPTDEDAPEFGIFPLIMGSLSVTALSSLIAIPLGVMTALYLAEIASPRMRGIVKPVIELLASLPSVVIGFFGMVIMAPFLQDTFGIANGLNMLNASIMLAFMSVPTITSVSEDAIFAVPLELKEASLALGATHNETIWKVVVPASLSGISTAVILGMSRAIGETMVVLMVAGGAGLVPSSIFDPVRPMPASIAAEMGEAPFGEPHYFALFAIGIVLFLFTLLFNVIADHLAHKYKQVGAATL